jgi:hypothetical protein
MTLFRQNLLFAGLIVIALVVEVAILVWFFDERNDDDAVIGSGPESRLGETTDECGQASPSREPSNVRFDEGRRLAVKVPPKWTSRAEGSVVTVNKKNGEATLSVGLARPGGLLEALEDLRASLRRSYPNLEVTSVEPLSLDGCPARSVAGRARNRHGASLNFDAVVVAGPTENFVLAGFLERGTEPRLESKLDRVIQSVRFYLSEFGDRRARS